MTQTESAATESHVGKWKPYPAYKDSDVEGLGKIPAHWELRRLKYLTEDMIAGPFGSSLTKDLYTTEGYRVYGQEQVIPADFSVGDYYIPEDLYYAMKRYAVSVGDVLVSCVGTFGKVAVVPQEAEPGIINPRLAKLVPKKDVIIPPYLGLLLRSKVAFEQMEQVSRGGTMGVINLGLLSELQLPLPLLDEQHAITTFLDSETARINALIAKKERLIELLQEKRAALISHAVTKGLDPTMPMKDSGVDWLGEIPVHWKYLSVRNLIRDSQLSIQDGNHGELHPKAEDYVSEGIPFIMANNIRHGGIDLTNCKYISMETAESLRIGFAISGDVLLTHKGTLGETSIVPKMLNYPYIMLTPQVTFYRILKEALFNTFVYFYFQSKFFKKQMYLIASNQSTRDYVGLVAQKDLIIVLPPISEQKAIVTFLNSETVKIDALISRIRDGIEKLKEYSTALVSAAVTGKIDVRGEITSMDDIRH